MYSSTAYSTAEGIGATLGTTPLLMGLESLATKPRAGRESKNGVSRKNKKAVLYFVHTSKVIMDSSTD